MTYKQIEASREARLWVTQIIVPIICGVGMLMAVPEIRETVKTKTSEIKEKFRTRFKK